MIWLVVMEVFSMVLEWLMVGRQSTSEKELEILLLRRQLVILERKLNEPIRLSRREKLGAAHINVR